MRKVLILLAALLLPTPAFAACICTEDIPTHLEIADAYPAPAEGESEWVALLNTGSAEVDLSFYTLEDATAQPMNLSGSLAPGAEVQITDLSFQLNNGGDSLTLKTLDGATLDTLEYSSSNTGESVNSVELSSEESSEESSTASSPSLWPELSEVLPNPEGTDNTDEWIELYNPYDSALTLDGLLLDDQEGGSKVYALSGSLAAQDYLVISVVDSGLTLNNGTDSIRLLNVDGELLWSADYDDPPEGESYAKVNENWTWTDQLTPGEANLAHSEDAMADNSNGDLSDELSISEVYPDPEGSDQEDEWIEITNGGDEAVNLGNWSIDDGEGGSDPYIFPDDTVIEAGETIVIYRSESKIALNNSNEEVRLMDYTGETVDDVSYEQSVEGQAYAEIEVEESESLQASLTNLGKATKRTWEWVTPTPGEPNPRWQSFTGSVVAFQSPLLTLNNGIENREFQVENDQLGGILFREGNQILVQAFAQNGQFHVTSAELLQAAVEESKKSLPWGLIGSLILGALYLGYEWKKQHNKELAFSASPTSM